MTRYDPDKHHRRSIRLKEYDYAQPGAYFLTVCIQNLQGLLGTIMDRRMHLNGAGQMIQSWWNRLSNKFPTIETDEFSIGSNDPDPHMWGMGPLAGFSSLQTVI
jgi:putative transposase